MCHFLVAGRPIGEELEGAVDSEGAVELFLEALASASNCLLIPIGLDRREWEEAPSTLSFL